MQVTWEEKDVEQLGLLVGNSNDSELFITGYVGQGVKQRLGIVSLADGMFLDAGMSKKELAQYLTLYCYVPKAPRFNLMKFIKKEVL